MPRSFRWLRAGVKSKRLSVNISADLARWIAEQTLAEGVNATEIVNRALEAARERQPEPRI
jgi:hypothetical protein